MSSNQCLEVPVIPFRPRRSESRYLRGDRKTVRVPCEPTEEIQMGDVVLWTGKRAIRTKSLAKYFTAIRLDSMKTTVAIARSLFLGIALADQRTDRVDVGTAGDYRLAVPTQIVRFGEMATFFHNGIDLCDQTVETTLLFKYSIGIFVSDSIEDLVNIAEVRIRSVIMREGVAT